MLLMGYSALKAGETTKRINSEVHEQIIASTEDASSGSGTVRVRRATVGAGTQGCTVTVQQYVRTNPESLYKEPPQYISHGCSGL